MEDRTPTATDRELALLMALGDGDEPVRTAPAPGQTAGAETPRESLDSQILAGLVSP
jgi:hypothetical protein